MSRSLEKLDFKSPTAIATEVAILGLLVWAAREKSRRRFDTLETIEGAGYPISQTVDDVPVFVYPQGDTFKIGTVDPEEGIIGVSGSVVDGGEGESQKVVFEPSATETDPRKLEILRSRLATLYESLVQK